MSQSEINTVPTLDGSNYKAWAMVMKAYLMSKTCWRVIRDTRPTGTAATEGAIKDWRSANAGQPVAKKISAVKRKGGNPSFSQQQQLPAQAQMHMQRQQAAQ